MWHSLFVGSLASVLTVPRTMPRKVCDVDGPSTFSKAKGAPRWRQIDLMMSRFR